MELSDLRIFRTVVSEGGVTRAAEKLHRVQSNITTRVRQLEEDLGVKLFIREGKRLHLSPAGQTLLSYADRLLDLARDARDAVQDSRPQGMLRLGSMESTAAVRLPAALSAYHDRFPDVTLELRTGNPQQLATAILEGELDAALVSEPIADAPFEKVPIYKEELVLIAAAGQPPIESAGDGTPRTLLAFENGCPHRKRLEDWFSSQGELPERIIELGSYHAMIGCTVAGMGVSLLPKSVLDGFAEKKRLSAHKLPPGQDYAETVLIWRKGAQSPKIDALIEVLKETRTG
ncbi:MAG: LysR family transcriptional regulator [Alphaproteobacteria bacterium]|nr:LysR family transcriptional regulator [Alphaproteobacteria bacterium]